MCFSAEEMLVMATDSLQIDDMQVSTFIFQIFLKGFECLPTILDKFNWSDQSSDSPIFTPEGRGMVYMGILYSHNKEGPPFA